MREWCISKRVQMQVCPARMWVGISKSIQVLKTGYGLRMQTSSEAATSMSLETY